MSVVELLLISIGLAMDAFAVCISDLLCFSGTKRRRLLALPIIFGLFQAGMPVLGYYFGSIFGDEIELLAGPIALVVLGFIGCSMIKEGLIRLKSAQGCSLEQRGLSALTIILQGIATSIDACAVGVMFRASGVHPAEASMLIGAVTCACCFCALALGRQCGRVLGEYAHIAGGLILVLIGLKLCFL